MRCSRQLVSRRHEGRSNNPGFGDDLRRQDKGGDTRAVSSEVAERVRWEQERAVRRVDLRAGRGGIRAEGGEGIFDVERGKEEVERREGCNFG